MIVLTSDRSLRWRLRCRIHGGRQPRRPNLIGRLTPLACRRTRRSVHDNNSFWPARGFAACRRCAPNRRPQVSLRSITTARLSDFRSALIVVFRSMDLMREWRWTRNEKSLVPPMTTDLAPVSGLTREFRGLQQFGHCEQKLRCFDLGVSVQPVAHCKATMLGFRMRCGIVRSQRSSEAARCFCRSCAGARR